MSQTLVPARARHVPGWLLRPGRSKRRWLQDEGQPLHSPANGCHAGMWAQSRILWESRILCETFQFLNIGD